MNVESDILMNIMYSPAAYTDKSHFSDFYRSIVTPDFLLNSWLLDKYGLNDLPDFFLPDNEFLLLILNSWNRLHFAAELIGFYLLRDKLPLCAKKLMAHPCLLNFISLPLSYNAQFTYDVTIADAIAYGAAFILKILPKLPDALIQRYMLCFPAGMILPKIYVSKTPNNINLLKMAFNYAHNK